MTPPAPARPETADEPDQPAGIETPDDWTPEQIKDFQQAWAERPERADRRTVEPGSRQPATFEFDGRPYWSGVPVVNGHRILTAQSVDIHIGSHREWPVVTLQLLAADMLKLLLAGVTVQVSDETRDALISLGWTPPGEAAAECATPARPRPCGAECDC